MSTPFLQAADNLATVLSAENAALAAGDLAGASAMLAAKTQAVAAFEAVRDEPAPAGPAAREIARRITILGAENRRLLERAIQVQGRVLEMILRAAPTAPDPMGYRALGGNRAPSRPPPMAIRASA